MKGSHFIYLWVFNPPGAGFDCITAAVVVLAVSVLYFSLKWFMKGPECQSKARSTLNNPIRSLMWKYFAVQFVRKNCHHHWSNLRPGQRGRHEPEHEGRPGHPRLQVRRQQYRRGRAPSSELDCYYYLTSASLSPELLGTTSRGGSNS